MRERPNKRALIRRLWATGRVPLPQRGEHLLVVAADVLQVAPADRARAPEAAAAVDDDVRPGAGGLLNGEDGFKHRPRIGQHTPIRNGKPTHHHPLEGFFDEGRDLQRAQLVVLEQTDQQPGVVRGHEVVEVAAYATRPVETLGEGDVVSLDAAPIDWVMITSGAIAEAAVRLFGERMRHWRIGSISPVTSRVLETLGFPPDCEAREASAALKQAERAFAKTAAGAALAKKRRAAKKAERASFR